MLLNKKTSWNLSNSSLIKDKYLVVQVVTCTGPVFTKKLKLSFNLV